MLIQVIILFLIINSVTIILFNFIIFKKEELYSIPLSDTSNSSALNDTPNSSVLSNNSNTFENNSTSSDRALTTSEIGSYYDEESQSKL
jgi:hypothetical protein